MSILEKLKTLNLNRLDGEEAVELVTQARALAETYGTYRVPAPAWLTDALAQLDSEIKRRHRDMLEARRKELLAQRTSLQTREQKAKAVDDELASLELSLGITPPTTP